MSATSRIEYSEKYADESHEYRYVLGAKSTSVSLSYRKNAHKHATSITFI